MFPFADRALLTLKESTYLNIVVILVPMLNFLSGVSIDLYAPSMPALALYFHTSTQMVQDTIAISMLGLGLGCLLCGILFDIYGRRKIVIISLLVFLVTSVAAAHCQTLTQLMWLRFIQGMTTAAMSVGSRTLIADHFTGQRFVVAVIYASFAYGLGPVVAPYIGGYLQYHFGWRANFYAYVVVSAILLTSTLLFIHERFQAKIRFNLTHIVGAYRMILSHGYFLAGVSLLGLVFLEQMLYSTIGPFLVQHHLGYNSIIYGRTSLLVGLSYLSSTFVNRFMIRFFTTRQLIAGGFTILLLALTAQLICTLLLPLNLLTIVAPLCALIFATGFIFPNVIAVCLRFFPNHIGMAGALQVFLSVCICTLGILLISEFTIISLRGIFAICLVPVVLQVVLYFPFFRRVLPR